MISGMLVAREKTVMPIKVEDKLKYAAIPISFFTATLALMTSTTMAIKPINAKIRVENEDISI